MYKRILLKLSGETLSGRENTGIDIEACLSTAKEIAELAKRSIQVGVVIGAGNIWRGADKKIDRVTADYMGMIATVMNGLALKEVFSLINVKSIVLSALEVIKVCQIYTKEIAESYLNNGYVVILVGGTGNPFFTTDTTAALRASELKVDLLLKATQVDGVYDNDPRKFPDAKRFTYLSYNDAINKNLRIMDMSAFLLCKENKIPIIVFDFHKKGNTLKVLNNKKIGTLIS